MVESSRNTLYIYFTLLFMYIYTSEFKKIQHRSWRQYFTLTSMNTLYMVADGTYQTS
jgi:hypothetical protein